VGVAVAPGGWAYDHAVYEITVFPPEGEPGYSQTKTVNACEVIEMGSASVHFDLQLRAVSPTQPIDLSISSGTGDDSFSRLEEALLRLKDLYERGLLTELEYREKRSEIIRSFSPK
jgi:hypothetical protein